MPPHAPSIDHLLKLNPAIPEPADFDAFWAGTLAASRKHDLNATFEPVKDDAFQLFNAYDLTFSGYDGQRIRGWVVEPAAARNAGKKLPCVVTYMGYGGGRSLPTDHLLFTTVGAVNLIMDNRGQGAQGTPGATGDIGTTGPQFSGMMTRGIDSRDTYLYRRLFTDAARAIEAAKAFDLVDPKRIVLFGANQGGAAALAAAAAVEWPRIAAKPEAGEVGRGRDSAPHTGLSPERSMFNASDEMRRRRRATRIEPLFPFREKHNINVPPEGL